MIEYLGELAMLDIKPDKSEYLLYDPQRSEFVRVDKEGKILQRKNLEEDGRDKFGDLFYTVHYIENNEILIFGTNQIHKYDQDLNLLGSSPFPFDIKSIFFNVGHVNLVHEGKLFTHSIALDVDKEFREREDFLSAYPFLTVYDLEKQEIINQEFIPPTTQLIQNPGKYMESAPFSLLEGDDLYVLFPNSPEVYKYRFPNLKLTETIPLNLGESYVQIEPVPYKGGKDFGSHYKALASSSFNMLSFSNGYLMVSYHGAAPKDAVDALPQGSGITDQFRQLKEKYQIPYYQISKDGKKLWEDHLDIDFKYKQGRIYATRNLHLPKVDKELDYITFYFYEIQ